MNNSASYFTSSLARTGPLPLHNTTSIYYRFQQLANSTGSSSTRISKHPEKQVSRSTWTFSLCENERKYECAWKRATLKRKICCMHKPLVLIILYFFPLSPSPHVSFSTYIHLQKYVSIPIHTIQKMYGH